MSTSDLYFSLTEIVSGSVAGQISSDSSNVVELIEVRREINIESENHNIAIKMSSSSRADTDSVLAGTI